MIKIGYKIRDLRKKNSMTLKDLSDKIDLSVSFLSGIERDMYCPSLETVSNLTDVFKITISELLGEEIKDKISVVKKKDSKEVISEDRNIKIEFLSKPATMDSKLELKIIEMAPKFKTEKPVWGAPGDEVIHVLEGQISMNIGGHIVHLDKGDTVQFDSSFTHCFENSGNVPVKMLVSSSPPNFSSLISGSKKS